MKVAFINEEDKSQLFDEVRIQLGAPIRSVPLGDKEMSVLVNWAIRDWSEYVNNWTIEQQWSGLYGLDLSRADLQFYLMTQTLDLEKKFAYAYNKQLGLQSNDEWELKKDFIELSANTQSYVIPAGREINEVLWYTRPTIDRGRLTALNNLDFVSTQYGWSVGGYPAAPINYIYNIISASQEFRSRDYLQRGDVTHRITNGPNRTKILHLYPIPGGRFDRGVLDWSSLFTGRGDNFLTDCYVYYFYYDVTKEDEDKCREDNKDIVLLPSDPDLPVVPWSKMNSPTQNWVRRYTLALAKRQMSIILGYYSGKVQIPNNEIQLNYSLYNEQYIKESDELKEELRKRLENISWDVLMEKRAKIAKSLNEVLSFVPMRIQTG